MTLNLLWRLTGLALICLFTPAGLAQVDTIVPKKGSSITGSIKSIDKNEVVIEVTGGPKKIPVIEIESIRLEGDQAFSRGRKEILDGQITQGLTELQRVDLSKITRPEAKVEYLYYLRYAGAKEAMEGRGDLSRARDGMLDFVSKNPKTWHFYEAAQVLGELSMALGKAEDAAKYFAALAASKFPEHQFQARYLEGMALLKMGKGAEALQRFNFLLGANVASADAVRIQKLAKSARVSALVLTGKTDEALKDLETLIVENDPADVEISARLYNAQGKCLLKKEDFEGATLAFLHTDLLFSASGDAHAEALMHLAELWNKLGHPDRAAAARSRLSQLYPGYKG